MGQILIILGVILAAGWMIDRAWALRGNPSKSTLNTKHEHRPKAKRDKTLKPSQTLRKDWLRLGRRS